MTPSSHPKLPQQRSSSRLVGLRGDDRRLGNGRGRGDDRRGLGKHRRIGCQDHRCVGGLRNLVADRHILDGDLSNLLQVSLLLRLAVLLGLLLLGLRGRLILQGRGRLFFDGRLGGRLLGNLSRLFGLLAGLRNLRLLLGLALRLRRLRGLIRLVGLLLGVGLLLALLLDARALLLYDTCPELGAEGGCVEVHAVLEGILLHGIRNELAHDHATAMAPVLLRNFGADIVHVLSDIIAIARAGLHHGRHDGRARLLEGRCCPVAFHSGGAHGESNGLRAPLLLNLHQRLGDAIGLHLVIQCQKATARRQRSGTRDGERKEDDGFAGHVGQQEI
mmetsp:Transcript_155988/g.500204  ORF Transcript_155988/g.500204 Transcript_155988/m.500204 type:complete len:332 (+) Transcript_155988:126-1121(+)